MAQGTLTFTLTLPVTFQNDGPDVVAGFPALDLWSQGGTRDEAARNLIEAAQLFIETCFERNTLDVVLKACGFQSAHGFPIAPGATRHDQPAEHLSVPLSLLAARNGSASYARQLRSPG